MRRKSFLSNRELEEGWRLIPKTEVGRMQMVVGMARCAVPARVQRAERIVRGWTARLGSVPRLNGAVTAQRTIPANFGFRD
jgi:hypothetical protein